jgi:UDP-GlcNAc:undecaprenyl-phosphate/decaprenyl-phosphate GlcNAc-1-phosphate transferase
MESFRHLVGTYQYFGWTAFIVTVFLTPLAMRAAHRFGVLDIPDRKLKPHARPIPYLGGAAICIAWATAVTASLLLGVVRDWQTLLPLLGGGIAMSVLGLVDDVRGITPKTRLLVGTAVITTTILLTGAGFQLVESTCAGISACLGCNLSLPSAVAVPLSVVISVFIVLGACNSSNLIDGLDGLCSGVTGIISLGFFLLASHLAVWNYSDTGDPIRLVLAIAMFGAALGFLPWNFNPAKIFMGDAGSVLLGYNCGILILLFAERGGILRWLVAALMIFALPVFDTALAMFRRWRAGRSIFEGDRSHFYDQLVQRGFSVRQTVLVCYGLTLMYAAMGLLLTWVRTQPDGKAAPAIRTRYAVPAYLGVCLITAFVAWRAGLTHPEESRAKQQSPPASH